MKFFIKHPKGCRVRILSNGFNLIWMKSNLSSRTSEVIFTNCRFMIERDSSNIYVICGMGVETM